MSPIEGNEKRTYGYGSDHFVVIATLGGLVMMTARALQEEDAGSAVIEYSLILAMISISLVMNLPPLQQGFCDFSDRVAQMLGASSACGGGGGSGNGGGGGSGGPGGGGGGGGSSNGGGGGGSGGPGGGSGGGSGPG